MEFISTKKHITISLIWLLMYLSIVPAQLSNYVLCIGGDGHVAFEIAADGRCTDTHDIEAEHAAVMLVETTRGENHCGSCIDLTVFAPLDTEFYLVPVQNVSIQPSSSVVAFMTYPTLASTMLTYTSLLDTPSVVDPTLISLRTTTLLI